MIWPRWLPIQARLPLIAQITAAVALMAAVTMPRWAEVPAGSVTAPSALPAQPAAVTAAPLQRPVDSIPAVTAAAARPAHLNLDVRHNFRSVDLLVTVDGKAALETTLAGSGKRFGLIGKRAERGFTRTLDVAPGVHVVRVRVRSADSKFDQTRVERFDLDSAAVASMRIAADKSGLSIVADRPPAAVVPAPEPTPVAPQATPVPQPPVTIQAGQVAPAGQVAQAAQAAQMAQAVQAAQEASALAELYQSLRSILIAIAGFIASAATGFVVQEFMRSRRELIFAAENAGASPANRRRRASGQTITSE